MKLRLLAFLLVSAAVLPSPWPSAAVAAVPSYCTPENGILCVPARYGDWEFYAHPAFVSLPTQGPFATFEEAIASQPPLYIGPGNWCTMVFSSAEHNINEPGFEPGYDDQGVNVTRFHTTTYDVTAFDPDCSQSWQVENLVKEERPPPRCPARIEATGPAWEWQVNPYGQEQSAYCWVSITAVRKRVCDVSKGNPCDVLSGIKVQTETDYVGAGELPLRFVRTYASNVAIARHLTRSSDYIYKSPLGIGWSATYYQSIELLGYAPITHAIAHRPDGRKEYFSGNGVTFNAEADNAARLSRLTDGSGTTTGWRYVTTDDVIETYDASGKLLSISSRGGITHTLAYSASSPYPQSVTDSFGNQLVFSHTAGVLQSVTAPGGGQVAFAYDQDKNLSVVTFPNSSQRQYHYDEGMPDRENLLTGLTDESGSRFATWTYQGTVVTSSEHAGGVDRYSFTFDWNGGGTRVVANPLGAETTYTTQVVLGARRLTGSSSTCAGCAEAKSISHDSQGNIATRVDFNDVETHYAYDLARNLETSRTEAFGTPRARTSTTQWHSTYRLPTQIDEPGKRTSFTHDPKGNVLTKTVLDTTTSQSRTWTFSYDAFGRALTEDGPRTDVLDVTTYAYYSCTAGSQCGQVHTIVDALGHVTTFNTYNAHGQPLTITDPNGVVTTLTYDLRQRLTSRTVGGEQTIFEHWPTGLLKKATLADGSFLQYTYDAAHRLTQITDAEGNRIVYTLDNMGNRTGEQHYDPSNALTQTRTRVFNTLNQLWKDIGAAGTAAVTTEFGYDDNGNQTSIAAPLNRNTAQQYDELNRLKQVTDPLSGITQYGYNPLDQLISVTDPRGLNTTYSHNALDDLLTQSSPDSGVTIHTYDEAGNVATRTDARGASVGGRVYAHDALNRMTQIQYPDQTITYAYDSCPNGIGRLCGMTDQSGSTAYEYDQHGRVTRKSQSTLVGASTHTRTVRYEYASGRLIALRTPEGQRINYIYDVAGRISEMSITWPDNSTSPLLSNVLYDPAGRVRGWTWANGTFEVREYDQDGRITDIDSAGASQYGYDDADRITSITSLAGNTSPSWSYEYDLLDRLTDADRAGLAETFSYDANGNRLMQGGTQSSTYSYSTPLTSNRLQSVAGALSRTYSYDAMGNIIGNGIVSFGYNGAGRMSSAGSMTYRYNGLGERTSKSPWSNQWTGYLYDEAGHLLEKCDVSTAGHCDIFFSTQYIWLGDIPVAALLPHVEYNEEGYVSVFYVGLYNVHTDHLNTPRRLTAGNGAVVWQWDSDPFGVGHPSVNVLGPADFDLRFPGQIFDPENWPWLHYNYYRDGYDPAVGRYTQSDPIGLDGGINTYAYALSNPISNIDPDGLQTPVLCANPANAAACAAAGVDTAASRAAARAAAEAARRLMDPKKRKGYWTCNARADCNDNIPGNCPEDPLKRFAFGIGVAKNLGDARNAAKSSATALLGCQPKHVSCKCTGPKGERYNGGC